MSLDPGTSTGWSTIPPESIACKLHYRIRGHWKNKIYQKPVAAVSVYINMTSSVCVGLTNSCPVEDLAPTESTSLHPYPKCLKQQRQIPTTLILLSPRLKCQDAANRRTWYLAHHLTGARPACPLL